MQVQAQSPPVRCIGIMSFTVANNGFLRLGGATQTAPTTQLSSVPLLTTGIPQASSKFVDDPTATNFNRIKHAYIFIISTAGAVTGKGAVRHNAGQIAAVDPSATLGTRAAVGDRIQILNGREAIFNFSLINLSGGNMEIDVEVYE